MCCLYSTPTCQLVGKYSYSPASLAGMALLGGGGASIIIFVAALGGIPTKSVTPPQSMGPVLAQDMVDYPAAFGAGHALRSGCQHDWGFTVFIPVYILTHGGPANSTLTIGYFIYRQVFYYGDLSVAAAAGLILLLVTVGFTIAQFHRFSQVVEY